ncbi:hypothetical protein ACFXKC_43665 [Streptomyces sp. NPDC059340]|uniref:hypothetical protein n=1 Tax=Streptomyces sp. NPDC059340 TaxID=3346806 RepID=UPI0036A15867
MALRVAQRDVGPAVGKVDDGAGQKSSRPLPRRPVFLGFLSDVFFFQVLTEREEKNSVAIIETGTDSYRLASTRARVEEPAKAGWPLQLPASKASRLGGRLAVEAHGYVCQRPAIPTGAQVIVDEGFSEPSPRLPSSPGVSPSGYGTVSGGLLGRSAATVASFSWSVRFDHLVAKAAQDATGDGRIRLGK